MSHKTKPNNHKLHLPLCNWFVGGQKQPVAGGTDFITGHVWLLK